MNNPPDIIANKKYITQEDIAEELFGYIPKEKLEQWRQEARQEIEAYQYELDLISKWR